MIKTFYQKLLLYLLPLVLLISLIYFGFFIFHTTDNLDTTTRKQGNLLADSLAHSSELGVMSRDATFMVSIADGLIASEDIIFVGVYSKDGAPIIKRGDHGLVSPDVPKSVLDRVVNQSEIIAVKEKRLDGIEYYDFYAPVVPASSIKYLSNNPEQGDSPNGVARISLSLEEIEQERNYLLLIGSLASLFIVLLGGGLTSLFSRKVSDPIKDLTSGVRKVGQGDFEHSIVISGEDEIAQLARAFNKMTKKIKDVRVRDKRINQIKSDFISIAAHQLRTPLTAIKWTFSLLEAEIKNKQMLSVIKDGKTGTSRMVRLINNLLDITNIEEGSFGFIFKKQDLVKVINKSIEDHAKLASDKKIAIKFDGLGEMNELFAEIDENRLKLVIDNFLTNAINYTPIGGGDIEFKVELPDDDSIKLSVNDLGIGVPRRKQSRLFSKFFRTKESTSMKTDGSGLGLYIASNIVKMHGGKVGYSENKPKGSKFFFTIPIRQPRNTDRLIKWE